MRPYQITPGGEWVDLDTIQSITPPYYDDCRGKVARMEWRHAFQSEARVWGVRQELVRPADDVYHGWLEPVLDESGVPTEVARMTREVFDPFFKAWTNRP